MVKVCGKFCNLEMNLLMTNTDIYLYEDVFFVTYNPSLLFWDMARWFDIVLAFYVPNPSSNYLNTKGIPVNQKYQCFLRVSK